MSCSPLLLCAGRPGQTNMIRRRRTGQCLLRNCANWRSRRTRRSICIARCKLSQSPPKRSSVMKETTPRFFSTSRVYTLLVQTPFRMINRCTIIRDRMANTKVLRRRRVLCLPLGSRRRRVCGCRAFEEEYVISRLILRAIPNPSQHHHFVLAASPVPHHHDMNTAFVHLRRVHHTPALTPASPLEPSGCWDSIHVFETMERGRQAHYKVTSTIMLQLITRRASADGSSDMKESVAWKHDGEIGLSGSMTRQVCVNACLPREGAMT